MSRPSYASAGRWFAGVSTRFEAARGRLEGVWGVVVVVVAAAIAAVVFGRFATGYAFQLLDTVWYYAMLTIGLNLVMGYAGQFDFGHTTFVAAGAYAGGLLMMAEPGLDFFIVLICGGLGAAVVAAVLAVPVFRFRGDYLALVTFGFALIAQAIALNLDVTGGPNGLPGIPVAHMGPIVFATNEEYFYLGLVLVVACALVVWGLMRLRAGRAILAVREDELAAATLGVDPWRAKVLAFVLAGAFAGLAGAYSAGLFAFVGPEQFGLDQAILLAEMVLVGGLGSIAGSIAGAVVFVAVTSILVVFVPQLSGHADFVIGLLMLAVILLRPQGLFGKPFVRRRA